MYYTCVCLAFSCLKYIAASWQTTAKMTKDTKGALRSSRQYPTPLVKGPKSKVLLANDTESLLTM